MAWSEIKKIVVFSHRHCSQLSMLLVLIPYQFGRGDWLQCLDSPDHTYWLQSENFSLSVIEGFFCWYHERVSVRLLHYGLFLENVGS